MAKMLLTKHLSIMFKNDVKVHRFPRNARMMHTNKEYIITSLCKHVTYWISSLPMVDLKDRSLVHAVQQQFVPYLHS